jgi:hypothetical protein
LSTLDNPPNLCKGLDLVERQGVERLARLEGLDLAPGGSSAWRLEGLDLVERLARVFLAWRG